MSIGKNVSSRPVLSCVDKKLRQGFVDLKKATVIELEELVERQNKLLRNRIFIDKLPDKGVKIIAFRDEVQYELNKRQQLLDSACDLLSNLKIDDTKSEDLEWNVEKKSYSKVELDSDDEDEGEEETDPLKILATHSGTGYAAKKSVNFQPVGKDSSNGKITYVNKMCNKYDAVVQKKERFKPNQLKGNSKDLFNASAEKLKARLGAKWEVTEATPPIFKIKSAKFITLMESIQLQKEQVDKMKETEKKYAAEKLLFSMNIKMGDKLPVNNIEEYRNRVNDFDESINWEKSEEEDESDEN